MAQGTPIVTQVRQTSTLNSNNQLVAAYAVQFTVGTDGPFTIDFPAADFTAENVKKRLGEFAQELGNLPRG